MAFPDDPTDLRASAEFGANLTTSPGSLTFPDDISDYTKPYVTIRRGRLSRSATTAPTSIDLMLRNPDGIFSPPNITGPHYGNLREQTPIRVELDPGSGMVTRGTAYIPDWPTESTGPDIDDRIPISAAGIIERLSIGQDTKSALKRTILASNPIAYWPLEDEADAGSGGSAVIGDPMSTSGTIEWGAESDLAGAERAPNISAGALFAPVAGGSSTSWHVEMLFKGGFFNTAFARIYTESDAVQTWRLFWPQDASDDVSIIVTDSTGTGVGTVSGGAAVGADWENAWHHIAVTAEQSGGNVAMELYVDGALYASGTVVTATLGAVSEVWANHQVVTEIAAAAHIAVGDGTEISSAASAIDGFAGEQASVRFARLCTEEGLDHDVAAGDTQTMGPQRPGEILDLLRECELADEGVMVERLTGELGFDPVAARYNQTPAMTIPYEAVESLNPDNSVRDAINRATVTRIGGSSAAYERTDGPRGSSKVTGIGVYPADPSRSLAADSDAAHHAGWIVNLGTVNEPKLVAVLNLTHNSDLITSWLACDIGSRIVIDPPATDHESFNPFAQRFGPAPLDMILEGYEETLDAIDWLVVLYLEPYLPYQALEIESGPDNTSRIPAAGSVTDAEYGPSVTSLSVTSPSTDTRWVDSAAYSSKFPIDIIIAGERMSCTAIVGTTATQTFTVARGSGGVTKTLPSGSEVQLYHPARLPL